MTQLADVQCWIKVINDASGKVVADGGTVFPPATVVVRYVIANDSHKVAGPFYVVGVLRRDGVKVPGDANVVPAQQITVQPNQIWKKEYTLSEPGNATYVAKMLSDVGNFIDEEDEKNNTATMTFFVEEPIR